MLLKNLIKLPEKTVFEEETRRKNTYETMTDIINAGGNEMIEIIGNLEIELDVEKIAKIVAPISTKYHDNSIPYEGTGIDEGIRQIAKALANNFKEIIK